MPTQHAKLSASGASRWINCPGSVHLESGFSDTSSDFAKEGTLAHNIAEIKLQKYFTKNFGLKKFKTEMEVLKDNDLYQQEIDRYTDEYFDFIKSKALSFKSAPYVSIEERVDFSKYVPEGFGTADCVMIYGDELNVIDLKYGKGVPVFAENNPQLMLYGLGAYEGYSVFYNIKKVNLVIVQPRLDNVSEWRVDIDELIEFGERINPIAIEAYQGSDKFSVGEHCKFCKAKHQCRARANKMFSAVEKAKPLVGKDLKTLLSAQDIAYYLSSTEGVAKWIGDLEEEALNKCLSGEEVTGYKAVEGRSNRTFKDIDIAFSVLTKNGYDEVLLYERKPLTLSKVEKLVGKKEFNNILKDEIIKPKGKPTLVKETDKREKIINNGANNMFNKLEKVGK